MNNRNKMEVSVKGLMLAVVIVISLILSAVSLYLVTGAKGMINDGSTQYTKMMSEYTEINSTMYDGMVVLGSKVAEVIDEVTKDSVVAVTVKTKGNSTGKTYAGAAYTEASGASAEKRTANGGSPYQANTLGASSKDYINPNGTFKGSVEKNENGIVNKITFTQI